MRFRHAKFPPIGPTFSKATKSADLGQRAIRGLVSDGQYPGVTQVARGARARLVAIVGCGARRPVCGTSQIVRRQRGQAMTEYLVIVALVAVAAIAVYQSFGQVIRSQVAGLAKELAGESASQAVDAAKTASGDALKQKRLKSLKSYGNSER